MEFDEFMISSPLAKNDKIKKVNTLTQSDEDNDQFKLSEKKIKINLNILSKNGTNDDKNSNLLGVGKENVVDKNTIEDMLNSPSMADIKQGMKDFDKLKK